MHLRSELFVLCCRCLAFCDSIIFWNLMLREDTVTIKGLPRSLPQTQTLLWKTFPEIACFCNATRSLQQNLIYWVCKPRFNTNINTAQCRLFAFGLLSLFSPIFHVLHSCRSHLQILCLSQKHLFSFQNFSQEN